MTVIDVKNYTCTVVSKKHSGIPITAPKKKKAEVMLYSRGQPYDDHVLGHVPTDCIIKG